MPRLSTLLICLAVVGIVAAVTWIATRSAHKPAMADIKPGAGSEYGDGFSRWQRARSGLALVLLLAVVGALLAVIVLVAGAVAITGLRTTVQ